MNNAPRIYLICGSGGVGKTTVSAALGLKFAREGNKTMVLTIDPARRLATALGLKDFTGEPKRVAVAGDATGGEFWAMMLDTKSTFDRIVEKYAPSKETRDRIFSNKLYQHMSHMLAGTQEYMAMEQLFEIHQSSRYDVIIVDTPPMQNARDFLAAPFKMMDMINNSMLHLLLKPTMRLGRSGMNHILRIFDRITGFAFMQDVSEMLIAFQDLLAGFESRACQVQTLLASPAARFIAVCTTHDYSVGEIRDLQGQLHEMNCELRYVVVNRVYEGPLFTQARLKSLAKELATVTTEARAGMLIENYRRFMPLIRNDRRMIAAISKLINKDRILTVPLHLSDVHDVDGLSQMAAAIDAIDVANP